jgi:hypothetical protein
MGERKRGGGTGKGKEKRKSGFRKTGVGKDEVVSLGFEV